MTHPNPRQELLCPQSYKSLNNKNVIISFVPIPTCFYYRFYTQIPLQRVIYFVEFSLV